MSNLRRFKQKLSAVSRLWEDKEYDKALAEVESLLHSWPGNAHLHILWASLVQLQEKPKHELDEAKQALQQAVELDKGSPAAAIELGYFLDNVEDNPQAASKAYAEAVPAARRLLLDGLIGQAKVFQQLGKREEFLRCLVEVLQLARFETSPKKTRSDESGADIIFESPKGQFHFIQLNGPHAEPIQDLLSEWIKNRSA
jgi:lipopolysaccharide biosynthesis regulator YciM